MSGSAPLEHYEALQRTRLRKKEILQSGKTPCISFGRISSTRQIKGNSLDFQTADAQAHMDREGLEAAFEIQRVESAKESGQRPGFELILWLAKQAAIPDLLFYDSSRVSRNPLDAARVLQLIEEGQVRVHLYGENKILTRDSSPEELLVLQIGFGVNKWENAKRAKGAKRNHAKNRERGIASRSIDRGGYIKGHDKKYIKDPDPQVQKEIMFIHDSWDTGRWTGLQEAVEELNESGIQTCIRFSEQRRQKDGSLRDGRYSKWTVQSLRQWLQNPFWCGKFYSRTEDRLFEGSHEPYISEERWRQRIEKAGWHFSHRSRGDKARGKYDGLIRCTCGMGLYLESPKKGKYIYYSHACKLRPNGSKKGYKRVNISLERLDRRVQEQLRKHRFGPQFANNLRTLVDAVLKEQRRSFGQENALLTRRITELEAERENILGVLRKGMFDDVSALNAEMNKINREIEYLEAEKKSKRSTDTQLIFQIGQVAETLQELPEAVLNAPPDGQREILMDLIDSMELDQEQNLRLVYKPMFAPIMREGVLDLVDGVREFEALLPR